MHLTDKLKEAVTHGSKHHDEAASQKTAQQTHHKNADDLKDSTSAQPIRNSNGQLNRQQQDSGINVSHASQFQGHGLDNLSTGSDTISRPPQAYTPNAPAGVAETSLLETDRIPEARPAELDPTIVPPKTLVTRGDPNPSHVHGKDHAKEVTKENGVRLPSPHLQTQMSPGDYTPMLYDAEKLQDVIKDDNTHGATTLVRPAHLGNEGRTANTGQLPGVESTNDSGAGSFFHDTAVDNEGGIPASGNMQGRSNMPGIPIPSVPIHRNSNASGAANVAEAQPKPSLTSEGTGAMSQVGVPNTADGADLEKEKTAERADLAEYSAAGSGASG